MKNATWQLQEAKNKLSEVIRRAREEGPQTITVRGEEVAVLVAATGARRTMPTSPVDDGPLQMRETPGAFDPPNQRAQRDEDLHAFFQRSPAAGIDFEVPPLPDSELRAIFPDDDAR